MYSMDPVVVAVDPGKTNMAVVIGHPAGVIYAIIQMSSPGRENDATTYCMEFKRFFRQFLANVKIHDVGIEAVISKRGLNYHHSAKVLHEIRSQLIDVFYADFNKRPREINNWAWKSYVLPEGYRGRSEKGSTRWFQDIYTLYGTSDVTDAIGIFQFTIKDHKYSFPLRCTRPEERLFDTQIRFLYDKTPVAREFEYNSELSVFSNAVYYTNRSTLPGMARVSVETLRDRDIQQYSVRNIGEVYLLVSKK
jgi:hypothetical protein